MKSSYRVLLFALVTCVVILTACDTASPKKVDSVSNSSSGSVTASASASAESSSRSVIFVDEAECRAMCHVPDPNETFDAGAKTQPVDHKGRATCLECHAKMDTHPLPATHTGRMDPACALCHKPVAVAK